MIRRATDQDISALKALWEDAFDDPLNYVDFFYNNVAKTGDTFVFEVENQIVSMLTMIPVEFVFQDKAVRAVYLYGCATLTKFRRKGIMKSMIRKAEQIAKTNGCALSVLVPGEKYLFKYYKDLGYAPDFNMNVVKLRHGVLDETIRSDAALEIDALQPERLYTLRETYLALIPHVRWYPSQLEFLLKDAKVYGEHTAHLVSEHGEAYAIYGMQDKHLFVKEVLGSATAAQHCLIAKIIERENPKGVFVHQPVLAELFRYDGEAMMYGMAKPLAGTHNIKDMEPFMNLMLD